MMNMADKINAIDEGIAFALKSVDSLEMALSMKYPPISIATMNATHGNVPAQ